MKVTEDVGLMVELQLFLHICGENVAIVAWYVANSSNFKPITRNKHHRKRNSSFETGYKN